MINLTPQYWKEFKADGLLFEDLIEELLNAVYPGQKFYKTKQTHDGNRDFEYFVPLLEGSQSKIWLECKYHTSHALPIHDVSMTLLMAYIKGISQILIFSYSKVNNTFFNYIAEYKAKSGKDVTIYSDTELEQLILTYKDKINFKRYFPAYENLSRVIAEPILKCKYVLKLHGPIQDSATIPENTNMIVGLNEEIASILYMINNGRMEKNVRLEFVTDKNSDCFEFASMPNMSVTVPCHSSVMVPFIFRLLKYRKGLQFPKIKVTEDTTQSQTYSISNKLEYHWLADAPIIGSSYKTIIQDSQKYISTQNHFSVITLSGTSGIGKTRIIRELLFNAQKQNYQICYVDSDKNVVSAKFLLDKIISSISELPLFDFEERNTVLYSTSKDTEESYAAHLLYDNNVDISKEKARIIKFLVELFRKRKCVLALDNIQKYDELSLEILRGVIEYSKNGKLNSKVIVCFNSDYTYSGTDADNLRKQLSYNASHDKKDYYYKELSGFQKEEAREYIEYCLSFNEEKKEKDNIEYTQSVDLLIKQFGKNPFFLKNILLYLEQEDILRRTKTTNYYITSIKRFSQCIKNIPPNIEALINMREELFLNKFSLTSIVKEDYEKTMRFMALMRHMPYIMYSRLIHNNELMKNLLNIGFLEIDKNRKIHFFHSVYERYFVSRYSPEDLSAEELIAFTILSERLFYQNDYFYAIFLAHYYAGSLTGDLFEKAVENIINWNIDTELSSVYLPIISRILENSVFVIDIHKYLKLYWTLSNVMLRREGIKSASEYTQIVYTKFVQNPVVFSEDLNVLVALLKEGILHLVNMHMPEKALEKATELLKTYEKNFIHTPYYSKTELLAIYNCLTICEYHLSHLEEALIVNDKVLDLCQNDMEELITALRARGDIYYHHSEAWKYKKEISFWWHKAYEKYIQEYGNNLKTDIKSHLKIATYIKEVLGNIIDKNYVVAKEKMIYLSKCLNNTDMVYYEIQIRFTKVIYLLTVEKNCSRYTENSYNEIIKLLNQCTDICVVYGNVYSYINCFYLRTICQVLYGKFEFAYDNYIKTFQLLSNSLLNSTEYRAWSFFFVEMVIFFRRINKHLPDNMLSAIRDNKLYEELIAIIDMKDENFEFFACNYRSSSPLHDLQEKNSFPTI